MNKQDRTLTIMGLLLDILFLAALIYWLRRKPKSVTVRGVADIQTTTPEARGQAMADPDFRPTWWPWEDA